MLSARIRGRTLQLGVLILVMTFGVYAKTALTPLQETMRIALGLSDNQIALLQGPALAWPSLLIAIPLGLLVDRYSRARIVFVLAVLVAIGSVMSVWASSFTELFIARGLVGLAAFAISPPALSLISDLYPLHQRGRAGMMLSIGSFGGVAAVFAAGGFLAATPHGWRWALLWLVGPFIVLALLLILLLREPARLGRVVEQPSISRSLLEFWSYRRLILLPAVGVVFVETALGGLMIWAAPSMARAFALTADRVGVIMAVALPLGGIAGMLAGGFLADLCQRTGGPRRTVTVLGILAFASTPLVFFSCIPHVLIASVLLGLAVAVLTTAMCMGVTLFIVVVPNELRGLCIGVLMGIGVSFAMGGGPLLVSLLSGVLGGEQKIGASLGLVGATAGMIAATACLMARNRVSAQVPQ